MFEQINAFLSHWEPTWLLLILAAGLFYERETRNWTIKEYYYDKEKDDRKKKTKTTKKTTTKPGGELVVEEQTEITEAVPQRTEDTSEEQK
jgi:hypothetical protein